MVNFGPLAAEIVSLVWGTPANFNGFRFLAALLHGTLVVGVSQTAAFNRGRHLYLAGRPSRWALAHVSSYYYTTPVIVYQLSEFQHQRMAPFRAAIASENKVWVEWLRSLKAKIELGEHFLYIMYRPVAAYNCRDVWTAALFSLEIDSIRPYGSLERDFLTKVFKLVNSYIMNDCRLFFDFSLPCEHLVEIKNKVTIAWNIHISANWCRLNYCSQLLYSH